MTGGHQFQRHATEDAIQCVTCGHKVSGAALSLVFGTCKPPISAERTALAHELHARIGDPMRDPTRCFLLAQVSNWLAGRIPLDAIITAPSSAA